MKKGFKEAFKILCIGIIVTCMMVGWQVEERRKAYENRTVKNINATFDIEQDEFVFNVLYDNDDLMKIATKDVLDAEHIVLLDALNVDFQGKQIDVFDIIARYNELLIAFDNISTQNIEGRTYIKAPDLIDIRDLETQFGKEEYQ